MVKDTGYEKRMARHSYISPESKLYLNITDLDQFCREHGLIVARMRELIAGKIKSYGGWRLADGSMNEDVARSLARQIRREYKGKLEAKAEKWYGGDWIVNVTNEETGEDIFIERVGDWSIAHAIGEWFLKDVGILADDEEEEGVLDI